MKPQDALTDQAELDSQARRAVFAELTPQGPRPLVRPSAHSVMFGPLAVLLAILPGLYGLTHWDLTPPGPWWGLRGLAVLDQRLWLDQSPMSESISGTVDYNALRNIALQPPLYAWAEAALVYLSPSRSPLATVLPSYIGGVALILFVYLQGRVWLGPGAAMLAAWLFAFHIRTLDAMQRAGPATLASAALVGSIQCYSLHIQAGQSGRIRGRILYAMGCGFCLGVSLMCVGLIGLSIIPIICLHQIALNAGESPLERPRHWSGVWRLAPGIFYGASALSVAMLIAAPWHVWMGLVHSGEFFMTLLEPSRTFGPVNRGPVGHLLEAAPVALPLAIFSAWASFKGTFDEGPAEGSPNDHLTRPRWQENAYRDEEEKSQTGLLLWTIWAFVTLGLSVYWPLGPQNTLNLSLAAPLALLSGQTLSALTRRRVSSRILIRLVPLMATGLAWWNWEGLRQSVARLQQEAWNADQLGELAPLLKGIVIIALVWVCCVLIWRWGRDSEQRSRLALGLFIVGILGLQATMGINELRFRHLISRQLLDLREAIVKRDNEAAIQHIHIVGTISPEALASLRPELLDPPPKNAIAFPPLRRNAPGIDPAGRLRFILRSALPRVPQTAHETIDTLFEAPAGQRLVIFVGPENRLSIADQSRLALEPIHPGLPKILTVFASLKSRSPGLANRPASDQPPSSIFSNNRNSRPARENLPSRLISEERKDE